MAERVVNIELKATDKASAEISKVQGKLNSWYKENRAEQRLQNGVIREATPAVRALSSAFVGNDGLVRGLETAYDGFQTFDAAVSGFSKSMEGKSGALAVLASNLSAIAGPVGIATGLTIGFYTAMYQLWTATEEANRKILDLKITLGEAKLEDKLSALNTELENLKKGVPSVERFVWLFAILAALKGGPVGAAIELLNAYMKAQNELKIKETEVAIQSTNKAIQKRNEEQLKSIPAILGSANALSDEIKKLDEKRAKLVQGSSAWYDLSVQIGRARAQQEKWNSTSKAIEQGLSPITPRSATTPQKPSVVGELQPVKEIEKVEASVKDLEVSFGEVFSMAWEQQGGLTSAWISGLDAVNMSIVDGVGQAFESMFGEANSLLEIFVQNFLAQLTSQAVTSAIGGLLSFFGGGGVFSFLGGLFHQGGVVPKAHSGMYINAPSSREVPIIARGGEYIFTEDQMKGLASMGRGQSITIQMNVNAIDAKSFSTFLGKKDVQMSLMKTLGKASRTGRTR